MPIRALEALVNMPNYEYKCRECETVFNFAHSVHEDKDSLGIECPNCSSTDVFRYLGNYGTATIVFKGTGWVVNDTALERIGMPKAQRESPEAQKYLKDL